MTNNAIRKLLYATIAACATAAVAGSIIFTLFFKAQCSFMSDAF